MSTKSREHLYGTSIRISAERGRNARVEADKLACIREEHSDARLSGTGAIFPHASDALIAGFRYFEVRCAGCDSHSTVDKRRLPSTNSDAVWRARTALWYVA